MSSPERNDPAAALSLTSVKLSDPVGSASQAPGYSTDERGGITAVPRATDSKLAQLTRSRVPRSDP